MPKRGMSMTAQNPGPGQPAVGAATPGDAGNGHDAGSNHTRGGTEPVLPDRAPEDTDAAWGDHPERDDDRLYRDRPPHWDDF
jgi:hypothetical protein